MNTALGRAYSPHKRGRGSVSDILVYVFLGIFTLLFIYPFYNVLIKSFADPYSAENQLIYIFPSKFDFSAYEYILSQTRFIRAFIISVCITVFGTALNMLLTICGGYALSKKNLPGRRIFINGIIITMLFNGGLIPYYLILKSLNFINNFLVLILPTAINTFYLIIFLNYFRTVPASLEEAARIDGANVGTNGGMQCCLYGYDGHAFDIDYYNKNNTYQYNYGHDCDAAGIMLCSSQAPGNDPDPNDKVVSNSIIRYNVFANNGRNPTLITRGDIFLQSFDQGVGYGSIDGVQIYNNTSIWNPAGNYPSFMIMPQTSFSGTLPRIFRNNVIISSTPELVTIAEPEVASFLLDFNQYWSTNGDPAWDWGGAVYYSLEGFKQGAGQEANGTYEDHLIDAPAYMPGNPLAPFVDSAMEAAADAGSSEKILGSGMAAPKFKLETVNGEEIGTDDLLGDVVLLSFINTGSTGKASASSGLEGYSEKLQSSLAQINFLKSMDAQFGSKGVRVVLVDSSYINGGSRKANDDYLQNFRYDFNLGSIPLLKDSKSSGIAAKYSVSNLPATFIISSDGTLLHRWDNVAYTWQMGLMLEELVGAPKYRAARTGQ